MINRILEHKKQSLENKKKSLPLDLLIKKTASCKKSKNNFKENISKPGRLNLIAEIKRSSPSLGIFKKNADIKAIAKIYKKEGVDAVSVLTEEKFFNGLDSDLLLVKNETALPVLRKDFIIDEYQVYESVLLGADAILLIAKIVTPKQLSNLYVLANKLNLYSIAEVHDEKDLDKVLEAGCDIIGVNNRNLDTLQIDLETSFRLIRLIPESKVKISESGVENNDHMKYLKGLGFNSVLIGTTFMQAEDIGVKIQEIMKGIN